jgi:chromosome segregation protein
MPEAEEVGMGKVAPEGADDREASGSPAAGEESGNDPGEASSPAFTELDTADVVQVIRDLQERLDYAYSIREALEADVETANAAMASLQGQNAGLKERIEFLETRDKLAVQLQSELDFLHDEKANSVREIQTLESRASDLTARNDALEKDLATARAISADMKKKAVELQMEVVRLQDRAASLGDLSGALETARSELAGATERVRELEAELDAASIAGSAAERDTRRMREVNESLRSEIEDIRSKREALEEEKRALRSKLLASDYENKRLREQHASLDLKLSDALKDKGDVQGRLHDARQTLIDVQNALESTRDKFKKRWATKPPPK